MAKGQKVKVSGAWRDVKKSYVKIAGVWREVKKSYVKIAGVWKETYSSGVGWVLSALVGGAYVNKDANTISITGNGQVGITYPVQLDMSIYDSVRVQFDATLANSTTGYTLIGLYSQPTGNYNENSILTNGTQETGNNNVIIIPASSITSLVWFKFFIYGTASSTTRTSTIKKIEARLISNSSFVTIWESQ